MTKLEGQLLEAVVFVKEWFNKLEAGLPSADPISALRQQYHAPVHKALDKAIEAASQAEGSKCCNHHPHYLGPRCELPKGHDGMHQSGNTEWNETPIPIHEPQCQSKHPTVHAQCDRKANHEGAHRREGLMRNIEWPPECICGERPQHLKACPLFHFCNCEYHLKSGHLGSCPNATQSHHKE